MESKRPKKELYEDKINGTGDWQNYATALEIYCDTIESQLQEEREKLKKLETIIRNGLGPEDLDNDCT